SRYQPIGKRTPWHSNRITGGIALNETGRRAHELMKSRERRKIRQRNVKLNASHLKSLARTNKADGSVFQPQSTAAPTITIALIRASVHGVLVQAIRQAAGLCVSRQ